MNKLLMAAVVLGTSVSAAQAATLNFSGTHDVANDVDYFYFQNNSASDVQIVMDTLSDGFDASLAVWRQVVGSGVSGLPENTDWELVEISYAAPRTANVADLSVSVNDFGIPLRNGYLGPSAFVPTGTSDPGTILAGLSAGVYLISVNGTLNDPNAFLPGELMSLGSSNFEQFSPNTYPHNFEFVVSGDAVSEVPQVPLPAAVWLFGSALVGLGAFGRRRPSVQA